MIILKLEAHPTIHTMLQIPMLETLSKRKKSLCILLQELGSEITTDEINKAIDQLKLNKAAGLDLILNEFIIYGKNPLLPLLLRLLNVMFLKGYFPESWSEGLILPLQPLG